MDLLKELKKEELPDDWKSTERFHSLDDYLISEGTWGGAHKFEYLTISPD